MNIDAFIKQFVESYIFGDLESMANITVPAGKTYGGVGYPMVSTTLAGMELLGELLWPNTDPFNDRLGNDYFLNYWDNYFSPEFQEYTGLGRLFRQLMRNGIAHTFVAKPGIFVEKGTNRQMSIDTSKQEIYIDCNVFFREFEDSYNKRVQPIINGTSTILTTKANMQARLDNLSHAYSDDSTRLFAGLPPLHSSTRNTSFRGRVPVSPLFTYQGVHPSGAATSILHTDSGEVPASTKTFTSSMNASTATIPSTTISFTSPSGALPPKTKP